MKSIKIPLAWGGDSADDTLADVMNKIREAAPSARFSRYGSVTSGGWPVFEITVDDNDAGVLDDLEGGAV